MSGLTIVIIASVPMVELVPTLVDSGARLDTHILARDPTETPNGQLHETNQSRVIYTDDLWQDMGHSNARAYVGRPTSHLMTDITRAPSSGPAEGGIHTMGHRSGDGVVQAVARYPNGVSVSGQEYDQEYHHRTWRPGLMEYVGEPVGDYGPEGKEFMFGSDEARSTVFLQDMGELNEIGLAQCCGAPALGDNMVKPAASFAQLGENEIEISGIHAGNGRKHVAARIPGGDSTNQQQDDHPGSPPTESMAVAPSSVSVREDSVEIKELRSKNERFRFVMQRDHILTLYMEKDAVWAIYLQAMGQPHPFPADGAIRLVLHTNGNLVAVDPSSRPVWSTDTANKASGPYTLTMQDDGNCVLLAGGGVRLWATNTHGWGRDIHRHNPCHG